MMGDNRHYSLDSREWGFVSEKKIIGKAWVVLFSKNDDGFKWGRVLKKIR
jgi:signal peptidase I